MTNITTFDIETLPSDHTKLFTAIHDELDAAVDEKPLPASIKNLKTAELQKDRAADFYRQEHAAVEEAAEDAVSSTSLLPGWGRICVIGYAFDDGEVFTRDSRTEGEHGMLAGFLQDVLHAHGRRDGSHTQPRFIGANTQFDLSFIWWRARQLGIAVPFELPWREPPYRGRYGDVLYEAFGTGPRSQAAHPWLGRGLTGLCARIGIPDEDEITGADVAACWARGQYDRVVAHCRQDVEKTRKAWRWLTR